jgi:hypothetical protein
MWSTDSLWFEVAIASIIFAVGNMAMGHFEERTPVWRRIGKYILLMAIVCGISIFAGRVIALTLIVASLLPVLYIHAWYLPRKKGINGWTGEPKRKYYEFRGWDTDIFHDRK